ncbi:AraC family transcriptional regulator [Pedobacter insulae]|uniref:AraC-type DNA-binding protein n=1 Tax=Pedobacter insulae TaxID=414048 RepID=A0A1I2YIP3_9SPHI|nr:AraC family transcriptional regulator [Pedobacter insulae]SFH25484.1 AraC-type DNA-binding protein [Pedobacter insulae]
MSSKIPIYAIETLKSYKNEGILVSEFGHYLSQNEQLLKPHKHTFYHLVFFTEGEGEQQIDFKKFDIKPGLIYFMIPGQVHHWNFSTKPSGYLINFARTYFSSLLLATDYLSRFHFFSGQPNAQVLALPPEIQQKITAIFEDILKEGLHEAPVNDDLVKILLLRVFIEIARFQATLEPFNKETYNHTLLANFMALIESNYTDLKLPKQYAALLYITPNHLNALCNDFLGVSAGSLIRDRVLLEAKRLLVNVDLRISEIADQLNFTDQSYFIKFFKKYEKMTPEKFRKSIIHGN